jgi:hypothetical protein
MEKFNTDISNGGLYGGFLSSMKKAHIPNLESSSYTKFGVNQTYSDQDMLWISLSSNKKLTKGNN